MRITFRKFTHGFDVVYARVLYICYLSAIWESILGQQTMTVGPQDNFRVMTADRQDELVLVLRHPYEPPSLSAFHIHIRQNAERPIMSLQIIATPEGCELWSFWWEGHDTVVQNRIENSITSAIIHWTTDRLPQPAAPTSLSARREALILDLARRGLSDREIAEEVSKQIRAIAPKTIGNIISELRKTYPDIPERRKKNRE